MPKKLVNNTPKKNFRSYFFLDRYVVSFKTLEKHPLFPRGIPMGRYEIAVTIEIKECEDPVDQNPVEQADGSYRLVISEKTASSIDECEQALLQTNYAAVRQAVAAHLTDLSKKKPKSKELRRTNSKRSSCAFLSSLRQRSHPSQQSRFGSVALRPALSNGLPLSFDSKW